MAFNMPAIMSQTDHTQTRGELTTELGKTPTPRIWGFLLDVGYVSDYEGGECSLEELVEWYRLHEKHYGDLPDRSVSGRRSRGRQDMLWLAFSRVCAELARQHPCVVSFRRDVLGDKLLSPSEVVDWVDRMSKKEGPGTRRLILDVAANTHTQNWRDSLVVAEATAVRTELIFLMVRDTGDGALRSFPVRCGGNTGRLKELTEILIVRYPWSEDQVVEFVLSDSVPLAFPATATVTQTSSRTSPPRISLSVDPRLNPRDLEAYYRSVRQVVLKGLGIERCRRVQAKDVRLVEHLLATPGTTWEARRAKWNRLRQKGRKYLDYPSFARDAKAAFRRITGRRWTQPQDAADESTWIRNEAGLSHGSRYQSRSST